MRFNICILIPLLLFGIAGCSFVPNELKTAEQLIESNPDSALYILRHISSGTYSSDQNRALYGLLLMETLSKKKLPMKPDSLLDYSIEYYSSHSDKERLAACYLYKARSYKYSYQYEKAMPFYLKALDEVQLSDNSTLTGRINFDLGDIYNIQKDFEVAREKYMLAYNHFVNAGLQPQAFYAQLNVGRTYHASKNFGKAKNYYKSIYKLAKDSIQQGALFQEIGLNFFDAQNYDSALFYYRKIVNYPYIEYNRSIRFCNLANIYFNLKQYDSAFYYAAGSFKFETDLRTQRECYRIMTNCEFIKGNTKNVTDYMNKYVALGDSIWKIDAQIKGSYIETMHSTKKEARNNWQLAVYLGSLILVILVVVYLLYRFFRHRTKEEKKQIYESNTVQKADSRKKVIQDKRTILQDKIQKIKAERSAEYKTMSLHEKEMQLKKIYEDLLHINDLTFFFAEMDIVLNGLVSRLKSRYKGLNQKELVWCCLKLLHIPNHDILILLDYKSHNSIKVLKTRLSDKLKLENATHLSNFLITVLTED